MWLLEWIPWLATTATIATAHAHASAASPNSTLAQLHDFINLASIAAHPGMHPNPRNPSRE
ncbi:hypothetical protein AZ78_2131 [Lysobacter capsici AZ78]|uniref:Uncharacterized protein n=1 Tax=Lysobacter capsici AZ78 TaxID=1444315 RepID=A0A120AGH4_9GAMM|nr:hypothetical protein [Lysobacter capsici]KWS04581.1 hypothetical protein AZ78_2131 [Lysobacter capsici AZ78]